MSASMVERIGKYEIKHLLGSGATGSVYLARDPFAERDVAIKVLDTPAAVASGFRRSMPG